MAVSAQAAANAVLKFAQDEGVSLTNMQVQKHVFLGQGFCLALLDRPLCYQDTHAWQWGPVVPKLYKALQKFGSGVVAGPIPSPDNLDISSMEAGILKSVWDAYKRYSGGQLSELTHRPGTPWSKTWDKQKFGVIPIEDIQEYYRSLVTRNS